MQAHWAQGKDQPEGSPHPRGTLDTHGLVASLPRNEEASWNLLCTLHMLSITCFYMLPVSVGFGPPVSLFMLQALSTHLKASQWKWRTLWKWGQRGRGSGGGEDVRGTGSRLWLPCKQTPSGPSPRMLCVGTGNAEPWLPCFSVNSQLERPSLQASLGCSVLEQMIPTGRP